MDKKEILIKIGNNIRAERNRAHLSQEGLAEKASISTRSLGEIERGESDAKISNFIAIMEALNVSFETLYKK